MIDTLSLLLAHFLLAFVAYKVMMSPDINVEPITTGRHYKAVGPRA